MFGGRRNNNNNNNNENRPSSLVSAMTPENAPTSSSGKNAITGFDPEGLERAAKAARDLDNSRNATGAIELIRTQELTKQHESAAKRAEMDAYTQQIRKENIEREAHEARKTLEAQTQHERHRAEYSDELERKRQVDMLNAQKYMQEEQLKKQEEMVARQEAMRRQTAEHEAELRTKTELAKVKAEAEGRTRQERDNHDLILERVRLEAQERRDTVLQAVKEGATFLGEGLSSYLDDVDKLRNTVLAVSGMALGIYAARTSLGIVGRYVESRLGKPSLVRETSRFTLSQLARDPWTSFRRRLHWNESQDALKGIVLEPSLEDRLRKVAVSTANTKRNRAPYRHLLLYGPPGTGKTMFAKGLAHHSGLDYAILTGGDIAPLGRDAVTELHKLFDWARTSRRGLLLFVDEADAFLQSRSVVVSSSPSSSSTPSTAPTTTSGTEGAMTTTSSAVGTTPPTTTATMTSTNRTMSEDQRNALNAFLYRTGTESDQFMMVYASNQPSQFDAAVLDRIDDMIEFDLPGPSERRKMIAHYMDRYLLNPPSWRARRVTIPSNEGEGIGAEEIDRVVSLTEGFSGRALSKLAIAWQAAAYGTSDAVLDRAAFFRTVELHTKGMRQKEEWAHGVGVGAGQHNLPSSSSPSSSSSTAKMGDESLSSEEVRRLTKDR